jgi:hypothetical protein
MTREKKEYQKPTLERLALIPRENVLADCFQPVSGSGDQFSPICDWGLSGGCYAGKIVAPPSVQYVP